MVQDFQSLFQYNLAYIGGAISCESCKLLLNGTNFVQCYGVNGGVISIEAEGMMQSFDVKFI